MAIHLSMIWGEYVNSHTPKTAALDLGNTHAKLLLSDGTFVTFSYTTDWLNEVESHIHFSRAEKLIVGASNSTAKKEMKNSPLARTLETSFADEILAPQNSLCNFSSIQGIGIDRVLGLIGAGTFGENDLIVVDVGTAITVSAMTKDKICLGGMIFPGIEVQLESLHRATSSLPHVRYEFNKNLIGEDTTHSIRSGVFCSVMGGIEYSRNFIAQSRFNHDAPTFYTGGGVQMLRDKLENSDPNANFQPHLVCRGLLEVAKNY